MPNASLIVETALLLLAAFLIGCVVGYGLRRLTIGKPKPASAPAEASAAPAAAEPGLVVAPTIAPVSGTMPKRTAAQRLAAAAPEPDAEPASAPLSAAEPAPAPGPAAAGMAPAHVAGQTTSGVVIPSPVEMPLAPEVAPESNEPEVVLAADVPPIDEAVHVLDPAASAEPGADTPIEISWSELTGKPESELRSRLEAESEVAAMRAVEGGWTPRAAPRSQPVELPEPIRDLAPAAATEPESLAAEGASDEEIAGALSAARSAVEAASAAADAALAEYAEPVAAQPPAHDGGSSRNHAPFGRPAGLDAPRDGRKDELRQIKGLTPQAEAALNALGIFHFDQIAAWDKKSAVWIDNHLALRGSVARDKWIEQARELAKARPPGFRAALRR